MIAVLPDITLIAPQAVLPRSSSAEWAAAPMEAIRLIDYEYAGLNAVAYDIANHWCEYAADYGTDTPEVLDYGKLPNPEQRVRSGSPKPSRLRPDGSIIDVLVTRCYGTSCYQNQNRIAPCNLCYHRVLKM